MNYIEFGKNNVMLSTVILGMMRISSLSPKETENLIETALESGINAFDLADCYADGLCERIVGKVLSNRPDLRDKMWIQSKCGIRRDDGINSLLLHRPDTLMETDEINEAIEAAVKAGKIIDFGVSNMNPMMIELLMRDVNARICTNQIQLSAAFTPSIDAGLHVNMSSDAGIERDGSILEYCKLNNIVIQAWSVLQYGFFEGVFIGNPKYAELNKVLDRIAEERGKITALTEIGYRSLDTENGYFEGLAPMDNTVPDWFTQTLDAITSTESGKSLAYMLIWANFSDTQFWLPFVTDDFRHEMCDDFLKFAEDTRIKLAPAFDLPDQV